MKLNVSLVVFLFGFSAFSQVGIGTSNPHAQLDIVANSPQDPSLIDGILIPRIEKFPTLNPTSNQHGMLVFLNSGTTQVPSGFYFWNFKETKWETISGSGFGNFYKPGTVANPNNITDAIYRTGNIGIGTQEITAKLQIALNSPADIGIKKGLDVDNNNPATDNFVTYGIDSNNRSATNAVKYGIRNNVGGLGTGVHYGIHNKTFQNSGTSDIYGIYNYVGRTFGAKSDNYGIYSEIGTDQGQGNIYGIYSKADGNSSANVFAGYFAGRLGIGLTPAEEYVLPATRGKNEQVMVSNNSGDVNWKYPNMMNYTSTGVLTGIYVIPEEVYTLRITSTVSSITIPEASINRGRTLILIAFPGMGNRPFNFLSGDTLYDLSSGTDITSISSGNRFMIQSIGTRWIVLFK